MIPLNEQIGESFMADFEENTWSFKMPDDFKITAGKFRITRIDESLEVDKVAPVGKTYWEEVLVSSGGLPTECGFYIVNNTGEWEELYYAGNSKWKLYPGHKHSEHHPAKSHNYSAGHCTIGGCGCKHFIHNPQKKVK